MFNMNGRVVVISGASSGLGDQMAHGFSKQGADLVIMARRFDRLEALADKLRANGTKCLPIQCDVTDTAAVNAAAEKAEKEFGKVDVLINNAGSNKGTSVLDTSDEDWQFTMDIDLTSIFKVSRAFGNIMKKNNYGRIINIASIYGMVGNTAMDSLPYHATKGGVVNMTRGMAAELSKYNITCNAICPGYFATELTQETLDTEFFQEYMKRTVPMQRYGKYGELNSAAIFLAAEESSYVTGVILPVDGGYTAI